MRQDKGSVSLEASMTFPFVLFAMLALFMVIRYFVAFEIMQHAMYESAREMSSYYYFWAVCGLEDLENDLGDTAARANKEMSDLIEPFNGIQQNMYRIADAFGNAAGSGTAMDTGAMDAISSIVDETESLSDNFDDALVQIDRVIDNPIQMMKYLFQAASGKGITKGVDHVMDCLSQALIKKHIPGRDLNAFLDAYGLKSFGSAAKWNHFAPDAKSGSGDIELCARYVFTVPIFNGYELPIVQRVIMKGWGRGV